MSKILFAWIGLADLNAALSELPGDFGPIGKALATNEYGHAILLSDHDLTKSKLYLGWVKSISNTPVHILPAKLSSPTHYGEIYEQAVKAIIDLRQERGDEAELYFHLSPGTPAMAAVWIILSKTRFPATLLESSREHGVRIVSVPFDISADYLPDLMRKPDEDLVRLSQGLSDTSPEFDDIIHRCTVMKRLVAMARRVASRNVPVLILGASGTGKELLARAIHKSSLRRSAPFVAVNCGALPTELVESELFGHEKGAFTGASAARLGYLEEANGGTLFLDELGELPHHAQVKLLRVLQDGQVYRVGSSKPRIVNFRLISATNRDLMAEVMAGNFREDLFHRIAVAVLRVPALREREGDVGLLVDAILARINRDAQGQPGFQDKHLSASARNLLIQQPWPGNVRELHNTLQRAAVWSNGATIDARDISESLLTFPTTQADAILHRPLGDTLDLPGLIRDVARHYLDRALKEAAGNKTKAAALVGLPSYQTLTNWLRRFGLEES
jgi:DNA-binding NtrC family response regulator